MTTPTPGPWQQHSDEAWYLIIGAIDGPDDGRMRYTSICEVDDSNDGSFANARLIAAAPEMREVCRMLTNTHCPLEDVITAARAALAKAGEPAGEESRQVIDSAAGRVIPSWPTAGDIRSEASRSLRAEAIPSPST